ncbi:superoxide dismutase family protein [Leptolyngbya ohadii]|uniref:superoxide dismutase family protein n=1 Tax=Leptolyngbya ohadii TaxID=1962290 RepID=UPI000B5A16DA|nr:superoxide dismutase family protein [Leptolyngbya ohadii]
MASLIWHRLRSLATVLFLTLILTLNGQTIALAATAQAILQGTTDPSTVAGVVNFKDTDDGLEIEATLTQAPDGTHGFHIHEFGSCTEAGNGAGGHYNPEGVKHGLLIENGFADAHAGDLGNLEVQSGQATYRATLPGLTLNSGKHPIAGRAVILHEKPDDFGQPVGNAGSRVGCGTIALSKSA